MSTHVGRDCQNEFNRVQSSSSEGGLTIIGSLLATLILCMGVMGYATVSAAEESTFGRTISDADTALKRGDTETAQNILKTLAEKDNGLAQLRLAEIYEVGGPGVKRDIVNAVKWYAKAANAGLAQAKARLGHLYLEGVGVLQDFKKARQYLDEAADDGNAQAQYDLGRMWQHGWGGEKNMPMAYAFYEFAAQRGSRPAKTARDALLNTLTPAQVSEGQALLAKLKSGILQPKKTQSSK